MSHDAIKVSPSELRDHMTIDDVCAAHDMLDEIDALREETRAQQEST